MSCEVFVISGQIFLAPIDQGISIHLSIESIRIYLEKQRNILNIGDDASSSVAVLYNTEKKRPNSQKKLPFSTSKYLTIFLPLLFVLSQSGNFT